MKRCPSCGASNPETQEICEQCGAPLDLPPGIEGGVLCAICGYRNPAEAIFCEQCGARLGSEGAPEEAEAAEPAGLDWLSALEGFLPETSPIPPAPSSDGIASEDQEAGALQWPIGEEAPAEAEPPSPDEGLEEPPPFEQPIREFPLSEEALSAPPFAEFPLETPEGTEAFPFPGLFPMAEEERVSPPSEGEAIPPLPAPELPGEIPASMLETSPKGTEPFLAWPPEWEEGEPPATGVALFRELPPEAPGQAEGAPGPEWESGALPEWLQGFAEAAEPFAPPSEAILPPAPEGPLGEEWALGGEVPHPGERFEEPAEAEKIPAPMGPFWIGEGSAEAPPAEAPPFTDLEAVLAEMPEWLQILQPVSEEGGEAPAEVIPAVESAVVETQGPLAGLVDVLPMNPQVLEPQGPAARLAAEPPADLLTRAQAWRSLLDHGLEFLIGERAVERAPAGLGATLERLLLFALLLGALIVGLYWPLPFFRADLLAPPREFLAALDRAPAGGLALVAVDYGPDRAAELEPYLQRVLDRLTAHGVRVLMVSLSPWGAAQAAQVVAGRPDYGERVVHLGYFPGQEVGAARLLAWPMDQLGADYRGQPLRSLSIAQDFGEEPLAARLHLVVLITGSPDALRGWVQQAQGQLPREVPMVAAVGMNLWPYAAPYRESGQLQAVAVGLRDALLFEGPPVEGSPAFFDLQAQTALQVFLIVLIGLGLAIRLLPLGAGAKG